MKPPKITLPPEYAGRITLSIAETCKAIGVGRSYLYDRIKKGELAVLNKNRRTLVPVGELLDWLARAS